MSSLTQKERDELIDKLAQENTDQMDIEELQRFFYIDQFDYYSREYSDEDLVEEAKDRGLY